MKIRVVETFIGRQGYAIIAGTYMDVSRQRAAAMGDKVICVDRISRPNQTNRHVSNES